MAHILSKLNFGNNALVVVKVTNYTQGGESFTLAELGLTGGLSAIVMIVDPSANIIPRYVGGGLVQLFGDNGADIQDIATTSGLNYVFAAVIQGV